MNWVLFLTIITFSGEEVQLHAQMPTYQVCIGAKIILENNPELLSVEYKEGFCVPAGEEA